MRTVSRAAILVCAAIICLSCATTVDVEKQKIKEIKESNKQIGKDNTVYVTPEEADDRERARREQDLNVIQTKQDVFIPVDIQTRRPLTQGQVVRDSMAAAMVTPQNFIGGTQFYDYNEHKQYPVVTKVLGLTVVQLDDGEIPIGVPFLSDTLRWEVTGDVWRTSDGRSIQLIMIKPFETGLTTNMIIVTNMRIYQLVLTSTRDSYMPMVRFRYPLDRARFITAETIRNEEIRKEQEQGGYYLSYNYKIKSRGRKPEWMPIEAWDDGHKTYVRLPRGVLQMEYPVIFEERNFIINYRVSENVMIMDKLIKKVTLRLNYKKVVIEKLPGEAQDVRRYAQRKVEVVGDKPPVENNVRFDIRGDVPWIPEKVLEYGGETYIVFKDNILESDKVLTIIDEKKDRVEYRQNGNVIIVPKVIRQLQLAYNNQMLTIVRR